MMQEVVLNYKMLVENVGDLINVSGYRNDYVARKLGISPQSFAVKKQRATWKANEIEKLLSIIENEETEDYFLGLIMQQISTKPDDLVTLEEFQKMKEWK